MIDNEDVDSISDANDKLPQVVLVGLVRQLRSAKLDIEYIKWRERDNPIDQKPNVEDINSAAFSLIAITFDLDENELKTRYLNGIRGKPRQLSRSAIASAGPFMPCVDRPQTRAYSYEEALAPFFALCCPVF